VGEKAITRLCGLTLGLVCAVGLVLNARSRTSFPWRASAT
jgi:hypothetical protein